METGSFQNESAWLFQKAEYARFYRKRSDEVSRNVSAGATSLRHEEDNPDAYYLNQVPMIAKLAQAVQA
jgi:hypothetical protein